MTVGTLYIVATPIGNLGDLSSRARDTLAAVDLVAAEDTRHTGQLLSHFGITTRQLSLHDHNERQVVPQLLAKLRAGQSIALVSDAGTPLISDPGYQLVSQARSSGITVSPVPGPSALVAALSAAGLATDRFCFEGFLPAKRPARRERIAAFAFDNRTVVLYESVHRVGDCLADLAEMLGDDRPAFIGREISKQHEQCVAADLRTLKQMLDDGRVPAKGEFVIVVAGAPVVEEKAGDAELRRVLQLLMAAVPGKKAASLAADILKRRPNDAYRMMLAIRDESPG